MFAGAKAPTNAKLLGRTKGHVQYTVNTEMDLTICHIYPNFGQLPTTAQLILFHVTFALYILAE